MKKDIDTSQIWEKVMNFSNKAPEFFNNVNPFINSFGDMLKSKDSKETFSHLFTMLDQLNQNQIKRAEKVTNQSTTPSKEKDGDISSSLSGNDLYDIFNSPAMQEIVKEVSANRRKKR